MYEDSVFSNDKIQYGRYAKMHRLPPTPCSGEDGKSFTAVPRVGGNQCRSLYKQCWTIGRNGFWKGWVAGAGRCNKTDYENWRKTGWREIENDNCRYVRRTMWVTALSGGCMSSSAARWEGGGWSRVVGIEEWATDTTSLLKTNSILFSQKTGKII